MALVLPRPRTLSVATALLFTLAACSTAPSPAEVVRRLIAADNRGDLASVLAAYTDDVEWEPRIGARVAGKAAIEARYRELFRAFDVALSVTIDDERVAGDSAVVTGATRGELRPKDGSARVVVDDMFLATLVATAGRWQVRHLAWGPRTPPASAPTAANPPRATGPVFPGGRPSMATAAATFDKNGVQPGQPLPALSLVDLDGKTVDLAAFTRGKALVLVTCSLTCNVARRQQAAITQLRQRLGDRASVVMVYTIDAHPSGDDCPYSGEPWVPPANETDGVLVRQPTELATRLALARRYAADWAAGTAVFVDTMDDASWHALGRAPNLGLVVDGAGTVVARCGWFDAVRIEAAVQGL